MNMLEFLNKISNETRLIFNQDLENGTQISMRDSPETGLFILQEFEDGSINIYREIETMDLQEMYDELTDKPNSVKFINNS